MGKVLFVIFVLLGSIAICSWLEKKRLQQIIKCKCGKHAWNGQGFGCHCHACGLYKKYEDEEVKRRFMFVVKMLEQKEVKSADGVDPKVEKKDK